MWLILWSVSGARGEQYSGSDVIYIQEEGLQSLASQACLCIFIAFQVDLGWRMPCRLPGHSARGLRPAGQW